MELFILGVFLGGSLGILLMACLSINTINKFSEQNTKLINECEAIIKSTRMLVEQDRLNANDYHYSNYERIYNAQTLEKAKAIALEEMKIIHDDNCIENSEEDTKKELADDHQSKN